MSKIKFYYAELNSKDDIIEKGFNTRKAFRNYFSDLVIPAKPEVVYLITIDDEIFITENNAMLCELLEPALNSAHPYYEGQDIHLHEYGSFEDAYAVALLMREPNKLCYN